MPDALVLDSSMMARSYAAVDAEASETMDAVMGWPSESCAAVRARDWARMLPTPPRPTDLACENTSGVSSKGQGQGRGRATTHLVALVGDLAAAVGRVVLVVAVVAWGGLDVACAASAGRFLHGADL